MGVAIYLPVLAPGSISGFAHRVAPVAAIVGATALLAISIEQLLRPAPQIRSYHVPVSSQGVLPLRLECYGNGPFPKAVSPAPLRQRDRAGLELTPGAHASESRP